MKTVMWSCVLGCISVASQSLATVFTNGSFEAPALSSGYHIWTSGTPIGAWETVIPAGRELEVIRDPYVGVTPFDGSQFITFNGNNLAPGGLVRQNFDTTPGTHYRVDFRTARLSFGAGALSLNATAVADPLGIPATLASMNAPAFAAPGVWSGHSFEFVATSLVSQLVFEDVSIATNNVDITLDAVQLTVVPSPGTMGAMGLAACMLGRRRR